MFLSQLPPEQLVWLWFGIPIFFLANWIGVCHLIALLSGWKRLAEKYPLRSDVEGKRFVYRSGQWRRRFNYNGCLFFTVTPSHLKISVALFFRPGHAPFRVPWEDIKATYVKARFSKMVELRFAKEGEIELRIGKKLADLIAEASGGRLRVTDSA
jgi:hypothetical protein